MTKVKLIYRWRKVHSWINGILDYNIIYRFKPLTPKDLIVNITYRCNSRCIMCNIWKRKPQREMSLTQWQQVLKDPIFKNIENLTISGGEPFLYPELHQTINLFINNLSSLHSVNINTNGLLSHKIISQFKAILVLAQMKNIAVSISVSLDGFGKLHNNIRRIPNAFNKVQKTISLLQKLQCRYNFFLGVGCVVNSRNLDKIRHLREWCQKQNIYLHLQLVGFHQTFVNNLDTKSVLDFSNHQLPILLKLIKQQETSQGNKILNFNNYYWHDMYSFYKFKTARTTPCPFLYDSFAIDCLGDIYYCLSERKIGNCFKGKTVSAIYYDPKNVAYRHQLSQTACLKCNSSCSVALAVRKELRHYLYYRLKKLSLNYAKLKAKD